MSKNTEAKANQDFTTSEHAKFKLHSLGELLNVSIFTLFTSLKQHFQEINISSYSIWKASTLSTWKCYGMWQASMLLSVILLYKD